MKTIYINESMIKQLKEGILKRSLPDELSNKLLQNKTSIGNNPAIPDIFDTPYLYKLSQNRFKEIESHLQKIGEINDVEETDVNSVLGRLIFKCKQVEKGFRDELEKICYNYVIGLFGVPEDCIDLIIELKDKVDINNDSVNLDPIDDGIEFDDINDALSIKSEVYKRRILDVLCVGAGMTISTHIESYQNEIRRLSPELCDLYNKILWLSNYSLFTQDVELTDYDKKQIGTVEVFMGNADEKVKIHSQGEIFPVLLSETIKGFMELFISHGLPKNKSRAMAIVSKSDYLKAEPWDMRMGPSIWEKFSSSFNDITFEEAPYVMRRVSSLDCDKFNFLMKEILAGTKKGKHIMSSICNKAKTDIEYDKFVDKMDKMKKNKGVITDEFIHEDELNESTENKQTAYVMVGIPGSGKSTWIKNNLGNIDIVSRDIIRAELGFTKNADEKAKLSSEQEEMVTKAENKRIKDLCLSGKNFVIDDINIGRFRKGLIKFLRKYNLKIVFVRVKTDLATCIKRREGQIPADVLTKLHNNLIEPQEGEYDELLTV